MVVVASATKVDNYAEPKYDTTEVEYAHHYQPQQQHQHQHQQHQPLHTVVEEEEPQYHHQAAAQQQQHHQYEHEVEEQKPRKHIPIIKSESHQDKDGSYKYQFETANGIHQQEHGYVKNAGQKEHEIQVAEGSYSYTDEHGHQIGVHYIADENGFRAIGDHLPTPPPMPEALAKAFAEVAAHPELYPEEEEEEEEQVHHQQHQHQPQQHYQHVEEQQSQQAYYHQAPAASAAANHRHHPVQAAPAPVHHQEYSSEEYKH